MSEIKNIKVEINNDCFFVSVGSETKVSYCGKEILIENDNFLKYIEYLFVIISGWKKEYINYNFIDGDYWNLLIEFENGDKKEYYGKGDFPENFEMIKIINQKLIEGDL